MRSLSDKGIDVPRSHAEMIRQCKEFRRSEFSRISTLTYQELQDWIQQAMDLVSKLFTSSDANQIAWAFYIIDCLRKLCPDQRLHLIDVTRKITMERNAEVAVFIAYVTAKLHKKADVAVVRGTLKLYEQRLKEFREPLASGYFLYYMARYAKKCVLLSADLFMTLVLTAMFVKNASVRIIVSKAIPGLFEIISATPVMANRFKAEFYQAADANIEIKDVVMVHGSLLIFEAILEAKWYEVITNVEHLYSSVMRLIHTKQPEIHLQALRCAVLAWPLDVEMYRQRCYLQVCRYLNDDNTLKTVSVSSARSFVVLMHLHPGFLSEFRNTHEVLRAMLCGGIPDGFEVLRTIAQKHKDMFKRNLKMIMAALSSVAITDGYAECVPELFAIYPMFWMEYHKQFLGSVLCVLKKSPSVAALNLISRCPELRDENLTEALLGLLEFKESSIRAAVPVALLRHTNYLNSGEMNVVIQTLMTAALCDASAQVRVAILRAMTKPFHRYLLSTTALQNLGALANDESYDVREAVMRLLMDINVIKPFAVHPVLRRVLLDDLFLLGSPRSHRLRCEMTKLLLIVIGATNDILPVYAPVICQITLDYFNQPRKRNVTIFESKSFYEIATNLTKSIDAIANIDISLIGRQFTDFVDVFMKVLLQNNDKILKLAVVEALTTLVSKGQARYPINRKGVFAKMSSIASKWSSRKLNLAVLKLMGVLGAVDQEQTPGLIASDTDEISIDHQHFYVQVTCKALLQILKDESLNASHFEATKVLVGIFEERDEVSFDAFVEFMPMFISEIRTTKNGKLLGLLQQLCTLAPAKWLTTFSDQLIALIYELWNSDVLLDVLGVVPALAAVLLDRFAPFLPQSISLLIDCVFSNRSSNSQICHEALISILSLRWISNDYMFLIVPELVGCAVYPTTLREVRIDALQTLRVLVQSCNLESHAGPIVRCVGHCVALSDPEIRHQALQVLYSLQVALGSGFAVYQEIVREFMVSLNIPMQTYREIESRRPPLSYEMFEAINTDDPSITVLKTSRSRESVGVTPYLPLSESIGFDQEDAHCTRKEWFKNFALLVIVRSPATCIAQASSLSKEIPQLADMLLPAAFLSCWEAESPEGQSVIVSVLTAALESKYLTATAKCVIVALMEFMDRAEAHVGISSELLYYSCRDTGNHGKAFYFANRWYRETGSNESKDAMISMAASMGLDRTAMGLAKVFADGPMPPVWCEELGDWSKALEGYSGDSPADISGKLRCLTKLMQWEKVLPFAPLADSMPEIRSVIATAIIKAYFYKGEIQEMLPWLQYADKEDSNSCIIKAMVMDRIGDRDGALKEIDATFDVLARRAQTVIKHDKASLYPTILDAMRLTELRESIEGTGSAQVWSERLKFVRKSFEVYFLILSVRFRYRRTNEQAIKLLRRAMKTHNPELYDAVLARLFPDGNYSNEVKSINAEEKWERGLHKEALDDIMAIDLTAEDPKLASHISFLRGQWIIRSAAHLEVADDIRKSLHHLVHATQLNAQNYKAWHRWAWASATLFMGDKSQSDAAINSITGFIECVKLRNDNCFSDLIQMVSIFFAADLDRDSFENVSRCISSLGDSFLLKVAPQLFAQLNTSNCEISRFVTNLIKGLLPAHFHALLYPLLLAQDESKDNESNIASDILMRFENINPDAVHQAQIVRNGLLKCATAALEHWIETMSKLSHLCVRRDFKAMQATIEAAKEGAPRNLEEAAFYEAHNRNIQGILTSLKQLQEFYSQKVFSSMVSNMKSFSEELKQELKEFKVIKLGAFAPELDQLKDSVLAVPGTYSNETDIVTISYFSPILEVISSKQHPRLVVIVGSDGQQHTSLLKGSEDLRLDQHVMQFFELVNMHINNGFPRDMRSLKLHVYSITPLSKMSGLIQFLDNTETLYKMISGFRLNRGIKLDSEVTAGKQIFVKDVDTLRPIQRMEVLRHVGETTPDTHLREVIWLRSASSGTWISRTVRFAQTTAIASIVGYILGLGDRHPSNIMMHKLSGDVIHIDFGDCFEIGQQRVEFPEAVPFRLTRMIRAAFGPAKIEGEFRTTCETTMKLIRSHRESIMTVLDIFMQVPLEGTEGQDTKVRSQPPNADAKKTKSSPMIFAPLPRPSLPSAEEPVRLNIRSALSRIADKITGHDFDNDAPLSPEDQVTRLIDDAQDTYRLAYMYHGWMPLW